MKSVSANSTDFIKLSQAGIASCFDVFFASDIVDTLNNEKKLQISVGNITEFVQLDEVEYQDNVSVSDTDVDFRFYLGNKFDGSNILDMKISQIEDTKTIYSDGSKYYLYVNGNKEIAYSFEFKDYK